MTPIYAVGDAWTALRMLEGHAMLVSHAYLGSSFVPWEKLLELRAAAPLLWADCGAFTQWTRAQKGKPHVALTVEGWAAFVVERAETFDRFISLDEIGDAEASLKNWLRLLELVPSELHEKIIPVWHEGDPLEHLDAYDPSARLVALGRTTGRRPGREGRRATFAFYDDAWNAYPDALYHSLGNCNPDLLQPYPFRTFDATTWQRDAAYSEELGWPWCSVSKDTRMRAYIEATDQIRHIPRAKPAQAGFAWAEVAT